jgi:outer membrane protein OmpA-like peptidoglycan-associated protein
MSKIRLFVIFNFFISTSIAQQSEEVSRNIESFPIDTVWFSETNQLKDRFVVKGIFFQLASYKLINPEDSARGVVNPKFMFQQLDSLVTVIKNDGGNFEIQCHLDGRVSKQSSERLSYSRAKTVYDYLIDKGVPEKQLSYKGFEGDVPRIYHGQELNYDYINSLKSLEDQENMHQLNRRIEVVRM